jgi:hypothetical protein
MTPLKNKYRQVINISFAIRYWRADIIKDKTVHMERLTDPRIKGKFNSLRLAVSNISAVFSAWDFKYRKDKAIGRWITTWRVIPSKETRISRMIMNSSAGNQPSAAMIALRNLKNTRGVHRLSAIMTIKPPRFAARFSQYSLTRWYLGAPVAKIIE